jgi:hypothetical protein
MSVRRLILVVGLTPVLALTGQAALSQGRHHGGGGHSGGSRHVSGGGSHSAAGASHRSAGAYHRSGGTYSRSGGAYSRSGGAYSQSGGTYARSGGRRPAPGGVAQRRHPRAGTGTGGYYYPYSGSHGYYGGYYGSYYRRPSYGYYRPYYYGGYDYGPSFYASLSFGWPYFTTWPYYSTWPYYTTWPYTSVGYGYDSADAPPYYEVYPDAGPPQTASRDAYESGAPAVPDRDSGRLRIDVRPDDASVWVDDQFRGSARDLRYLTLPAGPHVIELVRPGFAAERHPVEVVAGQTRDVLVELQRR